VFHGVEEEDEGDDNRVKYFIEFRSSLLLTDIRFCCDFEDTFGKIATRLLLIAGFYQMMKQNHNKKKYIYI